MATGADVVRESRHGGAHVARKLRIPSQKFGPESIVEAEQVMEHEHLAIALDTGANPDRRNPDGR